MRLVTLKQAKLALKALQSAKWLRTWLATLDIDFNVESSPDIEIDLDFYQYIPVAIVQQIFLEIRVLLARRSQALRFTDKVISQKEIDVGLKRLMGITLRILKRPWIRRNASGQVQQWRLGNRLASVSMSSPSWGKVSSPSNVWHWSKIVCRLVDVLYGSHWIPFLPTFISALR